MFLFIAYADSKELARINSFYIKLKGRAYCKRHNSSSSHATNDCNVFYRQIQLAVNEGRLTLHEMQDGKVSFPVHTIDLDIVKVLIWSEQSK
jgi:hypothetical protein